MPNNFEDKQSGRFPFLNHPWLFNGLLFCTNKGSNAELENIKGIGF